MRIDYRSAREKELLETRDHYEECSPGLGRAFVDEFDRQVLAIAAMPTRWMVVQREIRRALMKRFPYVIYFGIIDENSLRVSVVKHEKRHPAFGLSRR